MHEERATAFTNVAAHAQQSVAAIVAGTEIGIGAPIGTAFFINDEAYLATNAHVIREAERWKGQGVPVALYVPTFLPETSRIRGMEALEIGVLAIDDDYDVAVLRADNLRRTPGFLPLCVTKVPPGTELACTGYPLSQDLPVTVVCHAATPGTQEALVKVLSRGSKILGSFFLVDVPIPHGSNGSAVYLKEAPVAVGIASGSFLAPAAKERGVGENAPTSAFGYVRHLQHLVEILDEKRIAYSLAAPLADTVNE